MHKKSICIANSQKEILEWLIKLTRNKILRKKYGLKDSEKVLKLILK